MTLLNTPGTLLPTGFHAGESVKVVQARLGHKSAVETLDTYGHLWPDNDEGTRAAVDQALGTKIKAKTGQKQATS